LWEGVEYADIDIGGKIILKGILEKYDGMVRTGFSWLRIGTSGWQFLKRYRTFGFHKMLGNF
jgi:hypothetical protein